MAYVYRHIRLDTNTPFYIGIGNDTNYSRANFKHSRGSHWNNVVAKTNYEVEIMLDDLTFDYAKIKEIEFIEMYGRKDCGKGPLVNKTDGGDGCLGLIHTAEAREKMGAPNRGKKLSPEHIESIRWHGKNMSQETRDKISNSLKGKNTWSKGVKTPKHSEFMKGRFSGENNSTSKLTEKDVLEIREIYSQKILSAKKIGDMFGVGKSNILSIVNYKTWKHI